MSKEMVGKKFGKLVVLELTEGSRNSGKKKYMALCRCECGEVAEVERHNLKTGNTRWCKICASKHKSAHRTKHGHTRRHENPIGYRSYAVWNAMKSRCTNPKSKSYKDYGARGVNVCASWLYSYENFLSDMGLAPSPFHQIDRIDNNGDYEPSNCRWVTRTENARNKRSNFLITAFGKTQTLSEWAEETGIRRETISKRIKKYGKTSEQALTGKFKRKNSRIVVTPEGEFKNLTQAAKGLGMSISGMSSRIESINYPKYYYKE